MKPVVYSSRRIASTRQLDTDVLVDVDSKGRPVGLEFLDGSRIVSGIRKFQRRFHDAALRRIRVDALQRVFAG